MYKQKAKTKSKRGEFVCNGPYCEYYKVVGMRGESYLELE